MAVREHVQRGEGEARACLADGGTDDFGDAGNDAGDDAGVRLVPDIRSGTPAGPLGVRIRYFRDSRCEGTPLTADVTVE